MWSSRYTRAAALSVSVALSGCASGISQREAAGIARDFQSAHICRFIDISRDGGVRTGFDDRCREFEETMRRLEAGITLLRTTGDRIPLIVEYEALAQKDPAYRRSVEAALRANGYLNGNTTLDDGLQRELQLQCREVFAPDGSREYLCARRQSQGAPSNSKS